MEKKRVLLKMAPQPALHVDPVCGMTVDPSSAADTFEYDGTRYYFCMAGCRKKFEADPAKYLARASQSPDDHTHAHAHAPAPATPAPPGTIYTCPMHPEIRQDHPGA